MKKAPARNEKAIEVIEVHEGEMHFCLIGRRPLIIQRVGAKAKGELLYPRGRKTAADKASSLKHDPIAEFRDSPYRMRDPEAETVLAMPAANFKQSIAGAALDMPGAQKTQIGRLVWAVGEQIPIFGVPRLLMSVVRNQDINRTPDIRTRCILPEWACRVVISYVQPLIKEQTVIRLAHMAGLTNGIGDWRPQKGSNTYGQFSLVSEDNEDFVRICKRGTRAAQLDALENPVPYDEETEELLMWYHREIELRGAPAKPKAATESATMELMRSKKTHRRFRLSPAQVEAQRAQSRTPGKLLDDAARTTSRKRGSNGASRSRP